MSCIGIIRSEKNTKMAVSRSCSGALAAAEDGVIVNRPLV